MAIMQVVVMPAATAEIAVMAIMQVGVMPAATAESAAENPMWGGVMPAAITAESAAHHAAESVVAVRSEGSVEKYRL